MTPVLNPDGIVRAEPYSKLRHVTLARTVRVCITLAAQKPRQHYRIVGRISAVVVFGTCEHVSDIFYAHVSGMKMITNYHSKDSSTSGSAQSTQQCLKFDREFCFVPSAIPSKSDFALRVSRKGGEMLAQHD